MTAWLIAQLPGGQKGPPLQPLPHPLLPEPQLITPGMPWWVYAVVGVLITLLFGLVVWLLLRPAKARQPVLPRPWQKAMQGLHDLRARVESLAPPEAAHQLSELLRAYFLERYKIPAPFRTTRELFGGEIPPTSMALQRYEPLARLWDQLAFAPVPASASEAAALVEKAIAHMEEDRP